MRVLVVGGPALFAELLVMALCQERGLEVIGMAVDVDTAINLATNHDPDVLLVLTRDSDDGEMIAAARLRQELPNTRLVMIAASADRSALRRAVTIGCAGLVTHDREVHHLVTAVRSSHNGLVAIEGDDAISFPPASVIERGSLTARERDVLELLTQGAGTRQIAGQLFISLNTARNHIQRMIAKLGAHSRHEAVAIAFRTGLIPDRRSA